MADTKISALTAVTTPAGAQEIPVNDAGTTKKLTLTQVNAYTEPIATGSTSTVSAAFASDTYLAGSGVTVDPTRLVAGTIYRCRFFVSKTAAGTATPIISFRLGTAGTTADTALVTLTFGAQSAASDVGFIETFLNFRSVGSGTSAVVYGGGIIHHQQSTTGLTSLKVSAQTGTSAGFNSTTVTKIGISVNGGTSAAWTVDLVQADLLNLT